MAHNTFTLTGKHTTPAGVAHKGRVRVTPNTVLRDTAGGVVLSGPEYATLDDAAAWSIVLPCDSPGLNPATGIGYTITYQLQTSGINSQSFAAVAALAGTTVDVAQLVSETVPTPQTTILVGFQFESAARNPDALIAGTVTRNADGAAVSAPVVWPDGTPGTYTALTLSSAFPGAVDSYQITYGSPVVKTYTQPAITRDANGAAVTVPAITVS